MMQYAELLFKEVRINKVSLYELSDCHNLSFGGTFACQKLKLLKWPSYNACMHRMKPTQEQNPQLGIVGKGLQNPVQSSERLHPNLWCLGQVIEIFIHDQIFGYYAKFHAKSLILRHVVDSATFHRITKNTGP